MDIETVVTIAEPRGKNIPNITLEKARFYGRPNFAGEEDRFKDSRPKFTVIIPDDAVEPLRQLGYNVKTTVPTEEDLELGREQVNHLKVMIDPKSDITLIMGENIEKITYDNRPVIDRSRFDTIDMEIRGWHYNEEEVKAGYEEPKYSARLVDFVGVIIPSRLQAKYGHL